MYTTSQKFGIWKTFFCFWISFLLTKAAFDPKYSKNYEILFQFKITVFYLNIQWWPKLLEHLSYLRGFSCFCWIGHYNTHKTNYCWNYLRRKESTGILKMMDWPPQRPDLNPIEQIWAELENKLDRSIVQSKESLWLELQKAWDNISVEVLRKYIDTMPERCVAVIAAKGGHTKY